VYDRQILTDYFNGKRGTKTLEVLRELQSLREQAMIDWGERFSDKDTSVTVESIVDDYVRDIKRTARTQDTLRSCIDLLRVLAQSNDPNSQVLAEKLINNYLREEADALSVSLERIGESIDAEANEKVLHEDWSLMQDYIRWCIEKLAIEPRD